MKLYMLDIQSHQRLLAVKKNNERKAKLYGWLHTFGRAIVHILTANSELKIRQVKTYLGDSVWQIDDPITGHRIKFQTETEVRIWLDERFHRK